MKRNRSTITIVVAVSILLVAISLPAAGLDQYIAAAQQNGDNREKLELQYLGSRLQLDMGNLEAEMDSGIGIQTGGVEITAGKDQSGDTVVTLDPSVTLSFYDHDAELEFSSPIQINTTDASVSGTPGITFSRAIKTWETVGDTTLDDLEDQQSSLLMERSYQQGLLQIEMRVLQSLQTIITLEKQLKATTISIGDAEQSLISDIRIGLVRTGSTALLQREHSIARLKNSLASLQNNLLAELDDFKTLTGLEYEKLAADEFAQPSPQVDEQELGNGSVLLAAIDVAIARQKLADEEQGRAERELDESSPTYLISGGYTAALNSPIGDYSHTLKAGVSAAASGWTFGAGVTTVLDGSGITPSAYLSGSWSDTAENWDEYDALEIEILNNGIALAQTEYNSTMSDYRDSLVQIQLQIAAWEIAQAELELSLLETAQLLQDAEVAFERGVGTGDAVTDARHEVELLEYERVMLLLDGLLLENSIAQLQL